MTYPPSTHDFLWCPLYENVFRILGSTAIIVPLGDTKHENVGRTIVTTVGEEQVAFTYSEAVNAFDVVPSLNGPGRIPAIHFNGTDEEADSPDTAYWSRGDGVNDSTMSVGAWVYITDTAAGRHIIAKWTNSGNQREWRFYIDGSDNLIFQLRDESGPFNAQRQLAATVKQGAWHFYVATYDGGGGATAADGIKLYEDGVDVSGTATNNASYVAMENGTSVVSIGMRPPANGMYNGRMAGGPLGPFFVQRELSADEILRLYQLGRAVLNLS